MDLVNLIISLVSGIVGGNLAGSTLEGNKNLGGLGNSITGLIGGGAGGYLLKALGFIATAAAASPSIDGTMTTPQHFDIMSVLANIGGSGLGGAALTFLAVYIKDSVQKNT